MGLVLCSGWDWEGMQKPGMMRSWLSSRYGREAFQLKGCSLAFAESRCQLRIERIWVHCWGNPQWGWRAQKLVFTPLLVSTVVLLTKLHAVCSTYVYICFFIYITIKTTSEKTWKCIISIIKTLKRTDVVFECQKIEKFCLFNKR